MTRLVRADARFRSEHGGIVSWHCLSAGAHYDPERVAIGRLIGLDEHDLAPGAGFDTHGHAPGLRILSWVLEGVLRHEDDAGTVEVRPGELLIQCTGDGLRHSEVNASVQHPLRFVQTTLLDDAPRSVWSGPPPVPAFDVVRGDAALEPDTLAFVAAGSFTIGAVELTAGDAVALLGAARAIGTGELLVVATG